VSQLLIERAPAKINLTLHVVGQRSDGYHELESLVAFSRSGDVLTLRPGDEFKFHVDGPMAAMAGDPRKNLVVEAVRHLAVLIEGLKLGALHLTKNLPVAAGIGGGSSDAAAALRLLARANGLTIEDPRVSAAARATGADVPVCLTTRARIMTGIGERLGPVLRLPPLPTLIVNPRQALETGAVFAVLRARSGRGNGLGSHPQVTSGLSYEALLAALRKGRNDLEDAACMLAPIIIDVLAILAAARGCKLARMSGSGATCFGIFADCRAAGRAKKAILEAHPDWWVKSVLLN
jgi:4-diphosphocytidyl-2-C-methyl-D-erythritol kinase